MLDSEVQRWPAMSCEQLASELHDVQAYEAELDSKKYQAAKDYWLLLAESHLTRRLFGTMLRRIAALPLPAG